MVSRDDTASRADSRATVAPQKLLALGRGGKLENGVWQG